MEVIRRHSGLVRPPLPSAVAATIFARVALVIGTLLCVACHHIKSDYPAFLEKHSASPALPHVPISASYHVGEATQKHRVIIKSAAAGTGNKWIVEFGEMLDQTLQSSEVRAAFATLDRDTPGPSRYELVLDLIDYEVWGFSARIKLRAKVRRDGRVLSDKVYSANGTSQASTVIGNGAFAMRNALQVTNKDAVDAILRELLVDLEHAATLVAPPATAGADAVPAS